MYSQMLFCQLIVNLLFMDILNWPL